MSARVRYFDGETWWYEQTQVAAELGISTTTIAKWRQVTMPEVGPLVRTRKQGSRVLVPLVDVFYVMENRKRLLGAGVRLTPEAERAAKQKYVSTLQFISLDFALHRGEEYSQAEIGEFETREGTVFEAAVEHGRTYYGGQYAVRRARERGGEEDGS